MQSVFFRNNMPNEFGREEGYTNILAGDQRFFVLPLDMKIAPSMVRCSLCLLRESRWIHLCCHMSRNVHHVRNGLGGICAECIFVMNSIPMPFNLVVPLQCANCTGWTFMDIKTRTLHACAIGAYIPADGSELAKTTNP